MNHSARQPDSHQDDSSSGASMDESGKDRLQTAEDSPEVDDTAAEAMQADGFSDQETQTWTPPRGPVVKLIAWLILAMIGLGILAMIWGIAQNLY